MNALAPLRHDCTACGACCNNVRVRFVDQAEADRIRAIAADKGLADRVDQDWIEHHDGVCPFLEDGWKCGIHASHGMEAKPLICRTFPVAAVRTESGERVGIDPSSRGFRTSRHTGGELQWTDLPMVERHFPDNEVRLEQLLVQVALRPDANLGGIAGLLCGDPRHPGPELPAGLAERIVRRLQEADLAQHLKNPLIGNHNRLGLTPLATWLADADPAAARFALEPEEDRYAREVLASTLFLRLCGPSYPNVHAAAFMTVMGLIANALPGPTPEVYGAGVSAWLRMTRTPAFWVPLVPTPEAMIALIRG